ncbi:hypothetical protein ATO12_17070 [Aquimarina atlantica]|uniref:Uncharacterized protein n=1 Tax=Aquimarina atlantica TaxID=1317122 RepID=A0A023BUE0_9FLAO|nr:hypothetical protein [Aquimarina atlantica]EZH73647.1 hypothetical protein ATO12_17070 [Aquimarina atlantica]
MIGHIGTIFIIESLKKGELKTGSELYNDTLEKHYKYYPDIKDKLIFRLFVVENRNEFFDSINYIKYNCKTTKLGILLHLEMHGGKDAGLQLSNEEIIHWKELTDYLTYINLEACNKLYICMATCYGRSIYNAMDLKQTSPFCGYISASKPIKPIEILDDYRIIYENILESHNLIMAFEKLESKNKSSSFFYKDTDAVFKEVMEFTFAQIENNENAKEEYFKGVYDQLKENEINRTEIEIQEVYEIVKKDFENLYYPKFTLKNCH